MKLAVQRTRLPWEVEVMFLNFKTFVEYCLKLFWSELVHILDVYSNEMASVNFYVSL